MAKSCQNCRFFNRWALSVIQYDDDTALDSRICKKGVWKITPGMADEDISEKIFDGANCREHELCKGGTNGKH